MKLVAYLEWATYFCLGGLLVLALSDYTHSVNYYLGYEGFPELDHNVLIGMLWLIPLTAIYYTLFLLAQHSVSTLCKINLSLENLWPLSFSTGSIVAFTFVSKLDFLVRILYIKGNGITIFLSALATELLFLLVSFAVLWRGINHKKMPARQTWTAVCLVIAVVLVLIFGLPFLMDISLGSIFSEDRYLWR